MERTQYTYYVTVNYGMTAPSDGTGWQLERRHLAGAFGKFLQETKPFRITLSGQYTSFQSRHKPDLLEILRTDIHWSYYIPSLSAFPLNMKLVEITLLLLCTFNNNTKILHFL